MKAGTAFRLAWGVTALTCDAKRVLDRFSARLRDETDLEALGGELVGVSRENMRPEHASLWLRPPTGTHGGEGEARG